MKTISDILADIDNEPAVLEFIRRLFAMGFDTADIASALALPEARVWNIITHNDRRAA